MTTQFWEQCPTGQKTRLAFECPMHAQGVRPVLPVLVARGTAPGPLAVIVAGQHGRELHGPAGLARVFERLAPQKLRGTAVFLPCLNPAGMRMHSQDYPSEASRYRAGADNDCNMNRKWGQGAKTYSGCITDAVAAAFIDHADVVADLHGWASVSTAWGAERDRDLVLAFGLRMNHLRPAEAPCHHAGMLEAYVTGRNIPFVLAELAPQHNLNRESLSECERGIWNVLRHAGLLDDPVERPPEQFVAPSGQGETEVRSEGEGLCEPLVNQGDRVEKGQPIARLWSLDDFSDAETFGAPHDGVVFNLLRFRWGEDTPPSAIVHAGSMVALVQELTEVIDHSAS